MSLLYLPAQTREFNQDRGVGDVLNTEWPDPERLRHNEQLQAAVMGSLRLLKVCSAQITGLFEK